ncbi:MAG: transposase [Deltaproteobacteria bacterium]|nr:transposase [Deltaproteobacteria bacterium]MCB9489318.1 transposase [Deltaproteobacteria bacterium]
MMKESPYILNENERSVVLNRIIDTCSWRGWHLFAVHVRSNHVHVVVQADTSPERAIAAFKANATRGLKEIEDSSRQGKRWAHHGSTQYIWNRDGLDTAINYVIDEQGKAMATYISPRR